MGRCYVVGYRKYKTREQREVTVFANTRRSAVKHTRPGVPADWDTMWIRVATAEERAAKLKGAK